jgi:NADPH:quinone reductase-like Zn-dependent oxidoreductase
LIAYDTGNVADAVKKAHPDGIDAVLDVVDDEDAIKAMAGLVHPGGRVLSTIGAVDVDWFARRHIAADNLYTMDAPQGSHAGLRTLLELVEQERIRVVIAKEYPLVEAVDALELSKSGSVVGKLVITVD